MFIVVLVVRGVAGFSVVDYACVYNLVHLLVLIVHIQHNDEYGTVLSLYT